jgi:hypothetical protein
MVLAFPRNISVEPPRSNANADLNGSRRVRSVAIDLEDSAAAALGAQFSNRPRPYRLAVLINVEH